MNTLNKKLLPAILISLFLIPAASFAITSTEDRSAMENVTMEMSTTAKAVKDYSITQRDIAMTQIQTSLEKLDAQITRIEKQLGDKTEQIDKAAHKKATVALKSVQHDRKQVAKLYKDMQSSTTATWQKVKTSFLKSYVSLQSHFDKAQKIL